MEESRVKENRFTEERFLSSKMVVEKIAPNENRKKDFNSYLLQSPDFSTEIGAMNLPLFLGAVLT